MNDLVLKVKIKEVNPYGSPKIDMSDEDFQAHGFLFGDVLDIFFDNGYTVYDVPYLSGFYIKRGKPVIVSYPQDPNPTICYNYLSMAKEGNIKADMEVTLVLKEKGKYKELNDMMDIHYTNDRNDYLDMSDAQFANARMIKTSNIKPGILYRSSSPFENKIRRNIYAAEFAKKNGINTVLNLSDTRELLQSYLEDDDYILHPYAEYLIKNDHVIASYIKIDYTTKEYHEVLVNGLIKLANSDGPYLIHCLEGKDRAGFTCALLEALMGASAYEIVSDYMITYENYFKLFKDKEPVKYECIVEDNILDMIKYIANDESASLAELNNKNMSKCAYELLINMGMSKENIELLISELIDK